MAVDLVLLQNPVNAGLLAFCIWFCWPVFSFFIPGSSSSKLASKPDSYNWIPDKHSSSLVWTQYTPLELRSFDGRDGKRILFAVNRKVYDVTAGASFYGPGGPYENFAGRDASRGMAKQSFDVDVLTPVGDPIDDLSDLTPREIENMKEWEQHFRSKYIMCGALIDAH